MNTSIFCGDDSIDIGCRVVKWDEDGGLDFTPFGKYHSQPDISKEDLQAQVQQFCLHWSVTYKAHDMFSGIKARGLSANFILDDDINDDGCATLYQCLDIKHGGYTQGGNFNVSARGVEISYMPNAWEHKDLYSEAIIASKKVQPHEIVDGHVHGQILKVFRPSEAQMKTVYNLLWGFVKLFPHIPAKFPRTDDGEFLTTVLPGPFTGLINHYNVTRNKVDAAGLDLAGIEDKLDELITLGY